MIALITLYLLTGEVKRYTYETTECELIKIDIKDAINTEYCRVRICRLYQQLIFR